MAEHQQYWNKDLIYNIKSRINHRTRKGQRLAVDMQMFRKTTAYWNGHQMEYKTFDAIDRNDEWTDISAEALQESGYKKVKGLYDSIIWFNVPVYMRIHGSKKFDVRTATDETGNLIFSQDTSATLHDAMQSNATQEFIKGMGKTSMASMDIQKIIMIALLGIGAFFGLYMMGVF